MTRALAAVLVASLAACGPSRRSISDAPLDPVFVVATGTATYVANGKRRILRFDEAGGSTGTEVATFDADLSGFALDPTRIVAWTTEGNLFDVPLDGSARKDHGPFASKELFGAGSIGETLVALVRTTNDAKGPIAGLLEIDRATSEEGGVSSPHREPTDFTIAGDSACWLDLGKRVFDPLGNVSGREDAAVWCWSKAGGPAQLASTAAGFTAFHADATDLAWSDGAKVFRRARSASQERTLDVSPPADGATVAQVVVDGAATWVRWLRADGKGDLVRVTDEGVSSLLASEAIRGDVAIVSGKAIVPFADRVEELAP